MRVADLNWMQFASRLEGDDRVVLPIGSTEQHAYLSLCTDSVLAERMAVEAAEPLGVPVMPVLSYGVTPNFRAYPGTVNLSTETFVRVVREILDSLHAGGARRILIVNGHAGNAPARALAAEWAAEHSGARVKMHDWWNAPRTSAMVDSIDSLAAHASWMENFPWTRLAGVAMPGERKPRPDMSRLREMTPAEIKEMLGDGNCGGLYQRSDDEMAAVWAAAVVETREQIESGWE
jgi:creatinine amidohydrolase